MGGLAGMVHFGADAPDREVLERMSAGLAHRGPDGAGSFAEGRIALAHRQRAVLPDHPVEPVVVDDLVLLMDGWIFDPDDVVAQAGGEPGPGHDTDALLAAWRRWRTDLVNHVEGAFAAAIWDRRAETLWLLRDRLGTRPLYYARAPGRFAFASELRPLLEVPWVSRELDLDNLSEYLSFRVVHAPRTLLASIRQVEPAHWLRLDRDSLVTRPYWTPRYASPEMPRPPEGDVIPALQDAVTRAVSRRLQGGAPTGLYLSGGLGSTAIAASARKLNRDLPTFTISFADDPFPESAFAGRVASLLHLEHHEVIVGTQDLMRSFDETVRALGHPVGNPAAILQLLLARATREHARVVLSGDGGEELLGGRMLDGLATGLRRAEVFGRVPGLLRQPLARALSNSRRGRAIATPVDGYGLSLGLGGYDLFSTEEREQLLLDPSLVRPDVRREVLAPFYSGLHTDPVNEVLHAYLRSWLVDESLPRADRTAAATGLDIRFPLLDREVFGMTAALPGSFKLRRTGTSVHTRWPLRAMLSGVLPPPLVNRPKRGMPAPLDRWLAGPGRRFLEERCDRLLDDPLRLWNPDAVAHLRTRIAEERGTGLRLWTLFFLDAWLDDVRR